MKVLWHSFLLIYILLIHSNGALAEDSKPLSRKEAMVLAEQTPEAMGLFNLDNGKYVNCIEKSVLRPCETDWVTCIDDAWVVKFQLGGACKVQHDGRVDLVIVVDSKGKKIVSRYPEKEYYNMPDYCQQDDECMILSDYTCYNFVYGQVNEKNRIKGHCECADNKCRQRND